MSTFADKSREQLVKARASAPTAAGYNRLDDSHIQAEVVLRLKKKANAAVRIQQWYRSYVSIWRHYGPSAFVGRQPDQIANFGKVFFPYVLRFGRHHRNDSRKPVSPLPMLPVPPMPPLQAVGRACRLILPLARALTRTGRRVRWPCS